MIQWVKSESAKARDTSSNDKSLYMFMVLECPWWEKMWYGIYGKP